jgi:glycosyltransferase involved in cell wall biosynthesis
MQLKYFKDPAQFNEPSWAGGRTLTYWNRRGMVSPAFLERFCRTLAIDTVLYRNELDPGADPRGAFELPETIGGARVERVERTPNRADHWKMIQAANVVIAPRLVEGVGMVFLEAMARGCAVFAADAPTMNEYITHLSNGILFRRRSFALRAVRSLQSRLSRAGVFPLRACIRGIDDRQDWSRFRSLDLEAIGRAARADHTAGYRAWQASIPDCALFILGSPTR